MSLYKAVEARPSNHQFGPGTPRGSSVFSCRSSRVEEMRFPWRVQLGKSIDFLQSSVRGLHFNMTVEGGKRIEMRALCEQGKRVRFLEV